MNISRSNECGIMKILTVFPLLVGESTVRIFLCFEICRHKLPFLVCGYRFQNSWDCKGTAGPFTSGFPIGVKRSVGTRFSDGKSSVLYLLRPLTLERGCWLLEHTISRGCRTGGFWRATGRNSGFVSQIKSGCSGVGGVAERR